LTSPRAAAIRGIVGVLATYRDNRAEQIRAMGSFGRETYYMFITDGRFITGPYRDWHKNNSFDAGTQWAVRYGNYRNAYAAMKLINSTSALTAGEKAGALAEDVRRARSAARHRGPRLDRRRGGHDR